MRILIADDHGIVRSGVKLLLDRQPDMEVVAEAEDGVDAFEQALRVKPDLCVMDVSMPRMTGLQAARHSGASRIEVSLEPCDSRIRLQVSDNGSGFAFAEEGKGLGLSGMRERALLVGGTLEIDSSPGRGTIVKLEVPAGEPRHDTDRIPKAAHPAEAA